MSNNNYSYFKSAEKENRPGLSIQERDRDILETLASYRFLSTGLVDALFPKSSPRGLKRRLRKLFEHGFLNRPKAQLGMRIFSGQKELIYSLGPEGVKELVRERDWKRSQLNWQTKEVRSAYLAHGLMVSRFRVVLELASKRPKTLAEEEYDSWLRKYKYSNGKPEENLKRSSFKRFYEAEREKKNELRKTGLNPEFELNRWDSGTYIRDHVLVGSRGEKEKFPVAPDGYFELEFPGRDKRNGKSCFFLEADRNTMSEERFLKKLEAYWWLTRREAKENLKSKLGMNSFRVVTVTNGKKRKDDLVEISKKADPKETGSDMFLFTAESSYSLEEPKTILQRIFETPASEGKKSILE